MSSVHNRVQVGDVAFHAYGAALQPLRGDEQFMAIVRQVKETPLDHGANAIMADYLEERGLTLQAEFHRWYAQSGLKAIVGPRRVAWPRKRIEDLVAFMPQWVEVGKTVVTGCNQPINAITALKAAWFARKLAS